MLFANSRYAFAAYRTFLLANLEHYHILNNSGDNNNVFVGGGQRRAR
jgi:hypothetical protein